MAATTSAVTAASTVEPSTTAAMESATAAAKTAALMPDLAASVIELRMMALVVMPFPRMVLVEVGIIVIAISPTI
jgi:hypothetical protein